MLGKKRKERYFAPRNNFCPLETSAVMKSLFVLLFCAVALCNTRVIAQTFSGDFVGVSFPTTASIQGFVAHNNAFFALTTAGVFQTDNGGQSWREVVINGQKTQAINSFNNRLYARTDSTSYFVSSDDANTWLPSTIQMAERFVVSSGAILKIKNAKLLRSTDAGVSWSVLFDGDYISDMVVFQSKIYLAKTAPGSPGYRDTTGCFVSSDHGISWKQLTIKPSQVFSFENTYFRAFSILPNNTLVATVMPRRISVGTYCSMPRSQDFYRLKDSIWEPIKSGLPRFSEPDEIYVYGKNILVLGWGQCNDSEWSNGGLFTSFDASTWNPVVIGNVGFQERCNDCINPSRLGTRNK